MNWLWLVRTGRSPGLTDRAASVIRSLPGCACMGLILGLSRGAHAQEPTTVQRNLPAIRLSAPPVIDGDLTDPCWQQAAKAERFVEAHSSRPTEDQTVAYLGYDDQNIYVGFHAFDRRPQEIVARQKTEGVFPDGDDWFSFSLDRGAGDPVEAPQLPQRAGPGHLRPELHPIPGAHRAQVVVVQYRRE
jgi:hypothetical protein